MIQVLGDMEQEGTDVIMLFRIMHHLRIAHIFHLMFLDCSWLQVTETSENENANDGQLP